MDSSFNFTLIALFLSLLFLTKILITRKKYKKKEKNSPPSPHNSLPVIGHLHLLSKPLHQSLSDLSTQYGPILLLRFGIRPVLSISSSSLAEECFTTNDIALADRPRLPSTVVTSYNHTNLALAAYGPNWREMRRIASVEALSGQGLVSFTQVRVDEVRALARNLFLSSGEVDLRSSLVGLVMNIIMRIIAGKRYYGEEEENNKDVHKFKEMIEKVLSLSGVTNVGDFMPNLIRWIVGRGLSKKMATYHKYRDDIIQEIIEEHRRRRREENKEGQEDLNKATKSMNKTMIDALLSLQEQQPERYTDVFIKALTLSLITAGTDTSSNTIEWSMSLLLNNPENLEKARLEIEEQVGHDRLINESDLNKLPYLRCIINETLRLYPAVPLLLPHSAREDCKIGGYDIKQGTMLLVNVYKIHRDPMIWTKPNEFLPERFEDLKVKVGMFMPFGIGRRKCPGEVLAFKEVGLVLGTLIQCFEWERIGLEEVDMTQGAGLTMPRANCLKALCKPRQYMINVLSQI